MSTEHELFEQIMNLYPQNPHETFVQETDALLRKRARNLTRTRKLKQFSLASTGIVLCAVVLTWFFVLNGNKVFLSHLDNRASNLQQDNKQTIFVYQSHDNESFIPELHVKDAEEAFDDKKNITLVGDHLSKALEKKNLKAVHDTTPISEKLKTRGLSFADSYKVSREPLLAALDKYKNIDTVLDIHRDSSSRSNTTTFINGTAYARIVFVVSALSPNYEENLKFATLLHNQLEKSLPGLSRGVVLKKKGETKNTYNQDLVDGSVLLEIGGAENTLEEEYHTADALAEVIFKVRGSK